MVHENATTTTTDPASPMTKAIMASVYFIVFLISELGNGYVILSILWLKNRKRRKAMDFFVLNLATTDFLFTTLSLFNCVEYLQDEWKFGKFACKLQGQFMEITYTVSTLTLATISFTRHRAANAVNPFRLLHDKPKVKWNIALVWLVSFVCSIPLMYAYTIVYNEFNHRQCTNTNFGETTRQMYYLFQTIVLFFIPLTIMLVSQHKITRSLRWQRELADSVTVEGSGTAHDRDMRSSSTTTPTTVHDLQDPTSKRHRRTNFSTRAALTERLITKLLTWVWVAFTLCWAPFITYRTLDYFTHIRKKGSIWNQLWYLCQLLILLNAAINPFLYYRITNRKMAVLTKGKFRKWCCVCRDGRQVDAISIPRRIQEITQ